MFCYTADCVAWPCVLKPNTCLQLAIDVVCGRTRALSEGGTIMHGRVDEATGIDVRTAGRVTSPTVPAWRRFAERRHHDPSLLVAEQGRGGPVAAGRLRWRQLPPQGQESERGGPGLAPRRFEGSRMAERYTHFAANRSKPWSMPPFLEGAPAMDREANHARRTAHDEEEPAQLLLRHRRHRYRAERRGPRVQRLYIYIYICMHTYNYTYIERFS